MDEIHELYKTLAGLRDGAEGSLRTRRLINGDRGKLVKKVVEEAAEVVIEAVADRRRGVIQESADLIYNLSVLWLDAGVSPEDVWAEMAHRRKVLGIAEKLPKGISLGGAKPARKDTKRLKAKPPKQPGKPRKRKSGGSKS